MSDPKICRRANAMLSPQYYEYTAPFGACPHVLTASLIHARFLRRRFIFRPVPPRGRSNTHLLLARLACCFALGSWIESNLRT